MTAAARALAQRTRDQRDRELRALAEMRERAETDRRLLLLRLEMTSTQSWRQNATVNDAADTLHLARLYAPLEPAAAAALPALEEHIRTRFGREPDEVLAEREAHIRQAREAAREAEAVWGAARAADPGTPAAPGDPAAARDGERAPAELFVPRPGYEVDPDPLQSAAGAWERLLRDPERGWGVDAYLHAWEMALPFVDEHPGPARAVVLAEEKLRDLYPTALAEFDQLRQRDGHAEALGELKSQLALVGREESARQHFTVMLGPDEGKEVDDGDVIRAWAASHIWGPIEDTRGFMRDEELEVVQSRAETRLRELAPQVMQRYDQLRQQDPRAVEKTVAALGTLNASGSTRRDAAPEPAGQSAPNAADFERGAAVSPEPRAGSHGRQRVDPGSLYAHPAGSSTQHKPTPGGTRDELAERALEQQRRRSAHRRAERDGQDRGGYSR